MNQDGIPIIRPDKNVLRGDRISDDRQNTNHQKGKCNAYGDIE